MDFQIGNKYKVKVVKIIKVGAIVELEDGTTELIHLSNVSNQYVSRIDDFISVGDTYEATCQEGKTKPFELTLRPLDLKPIKQDKIKQVFSSQVKSDHSKETSISKSNTKSSLDDMIAMMNEDYDDKFSSRKLDRYHRKQHYKNKHNRRDY